MPLVSDQPGRAFEAGQVDEFHLAPVFHVRDHAADRAPSDYLLSFDVHPQWSVLATRDCEHGDGSQTH